MVQTGEMNDNMIVVRKGLTADDHVLLTAPADKASIKTVAVPGLKPIDTTPSTDAARGVTLPAKKG